MVRSQVRNVQAPRAGLPADWVAVDRGPAAPDAAGAPADPDRAEGADGAEGTDGTEGAVLVLVHGLGTDAGTWNRLIDTLAGEHRVVAVDLPGYALTTLTTDVPSVDELADGLDALLEQLGIASAVFVGHSFGGAVSLVLAHRHPQRVAGLVLLAPGGFGSELNPLIPLVQTKVGARLLRGLYTPRATRTIERLADRVTERAIGGGDTRLRIAELMETYRRLRTEQAREQFRASVRQSLALSAAVDRREMASIDRSIPILVLWGRDDRVLPSWQAQNAATLLPWCVVHVLDGAGHTPHRSIPAVVRNEIDGFADRGDVRRRLTAAPAGARGGGQGGAHGTDTGDVSPEGS